jgi:hypothetical protein
VVVTGLKMAGELLVPFLLAVFIAMILLPKQFVMRLCKFNWKLKYLF